MATLSHPAIYDEIGLEYRKGRIPDPRIAAQLRAALGDARRIANIGAGTGSYEPDDLEVVALEPSRTMIAQREAGRLVRGVAERLPFGDDAFDAVLAVLTIHHWRDVDAGLAELCRVAPRRVVSTFIPDGQGDFWLVRDYLPALNRYEVGRAPSVEHVAEALDADRIEVVHVPWDCTDGFQAAYWRRPERYLDPVVRANISSIARLDAAVVEPAMARLRADLDSGRWAERNAALLERETMDFGYRLVICDGRRDA